MFGLDDDHCSAEDIGGNLGGACRCRRCEREAASELETGRTSYEGARSLLPRTISGRTPDPGPTLGEIARNGQIPRDGIDRSRYVYEGANGTPRPKSEVSPNTRLRVPLFDLSEIPKIDPVVPRSEPAFVMVCPPDSPELRTAIRRMQEERATMPHVLVHEPAEICVCGVNLTAMQRDGKVGHVCSSLVVSGPHVAEISVPVIELREHQLDAAARELAAYDPGLYETILRNFKIDAVKANAARMALRKVALAYAAAYLAADQAENGGDYHEAIAELQDPDLKESR